MTRLTPERDKYEEFKKAYDAVPSQDNEGYTPDRGSFKCGFFRAWDMRQAEIDALNNSLKYWVDKFHRITILSRDGCGLKTLGAEEEVAYPVPGEDNGDRA